MKKLDAEQKKAVTFPHTPLMLVASAGAGKTETLVQRIVEHVIGGIPAKRICLLTFTNKAADEMLSRCAGYIDSTDIYGGTFHGFAYRMLREVGFERGFYMGEKILTDYQAQRIFDATLKEIFDKPARKLAREHRISIAPALRKIYTGITVSNKSLGDFEIVKNLNVIVPDGVTKFFESYRSKKHDLDAFDFEDILLKFRQMLQIPDIQKRVSAKFDSYFVDEFQDLFPIQYDIIKLLVGSCRDITVVGDDKQSIYGFLGSAPRLMYRFLTDFSGTRIDLSKNYRSTPEIVSFANDIAAMSRDTLPFVMKASTTKHGDMPLVMKSHNPSIEAKLIVREIQDLIAAGTKPEDIAVLTRLSATTAILELELHKQKVPFLKVGGTDILRKDNIKCFLSLIEILLNRYDYSAWDIVLPFIPHIGTKTTAIIIEDMKKISDWDYKNLPPLSIGSGKRWAEMQKVFDGLSDIDFEIQNGGLSSQAIILKTFEIFKWVYTAFWFTLEEKEKQRLMNDCEVVEVSTYTEDKNLNKKISEVYTYIVKLSNERAEDLKQMLGGIAVASIGDDETSKAGKITVSTIHSAKGLEWEHVYVVGAEYGTLPPKDRVETQVDQDLPKIGLVNLKEQVNLQEELRLLYVAVTRAKSKLTISFTNERFDVGLNPCIYIEPYILRNSPINKVVNLQLSRFVDFGG